MEYNCIKRVLRQKGKSQVELADHLGRTYAMVNSYVNNRNQPSIPMLYRIGEFLEVSPKSLLNA